MKLEPILMPLDEIVRLRRNAKSHDLGALHVSFTRWGFLERIVVNRVTGRLLHGHGRVDALQQMKASGREPPPGIEAGGDGWLVPADYVELPEEEEEAAALALNRLTELGGWHDDMLAQVLSDLAAQDMLEGTGFDREDIDEILRDLAGSNISAGETPEPQIDKAAELAQEYGTAVGQTWQLGRHRLAIGDCIDKAVVIALAGDMRCGAVVTDPPYGIERDGIANDDPEGLRTLYNRCLAVMPIDNAVIMAFQSTRLFPVWLDAIREAGHHFERMLWVHKPNDETFPWRGWLLKSEAILVSSFGDGVWREVHPYVSDCYTFTGIGHELPKEWGAAHPAVKPLVVIQDLVNRVGGDVYDPFLGSGTTLIACEKLGRVCRAIELSPVYAAVAIQRWVDATGEKPVCVSLV